MAILWPLALPLSFPNVIVIVVVIVIITGIIIIMFDLLSCLLLESFSQEPTHCRVMRAQVMATLAQSKKQTQHIGATDTHSTTLELIDCLSTMTKDNLRMSYDTERLDSNGGNSVHEEPAFRGQSLALRE